MVDSCRVTSQCSQPGPGPSSYGIRMVRRSLRLGLRLGLVIGILVAVAKMVQSRRSSRHAPWTQPQEPPWPPVQAPRPSPEPPAPIVSERAPGVVKQAPAPAVDTDEAVAGTSETVPDTSAPMAETPLAADTAAPVVEITTETAAEEVAAPATPTTWVEPTGRICPPSHPIKAKLTSMLFHLPGMAAYNRTNPDRCYADETAAEQDGVTRARR